MPPLPLVRAIGYEHAADALLIIHCIISVVTVWVIYRLSLRVLGSRVANLAAFLCALMPNMALMVVLFWDSCISSLLLALLCWMAVLLRSDNDLRRWSMAALFAGAALLFNPALLFVALGLFAWATNRTKVSSKLVVALLCLVVVVAPWEVRCWRVTGRLVPLRNGMPLELWMGNRAGADGLLHGRAHPVGDANERSMYERMGETAYLDLKMAQFKRFVTEQPASFVRLTLRRIALFWGFRTGGFSPILLGALAGLWLLRRHPYSAIWTLPALLWPLPYYVTHADERFTAILEPVLYIAAAYLITVVVGSRTTAATTA